MIHTTNYSVPNLDLSWNAIGKDGGEAIGEALPNNKSLKTLILSSNGIESKACFTICMGILEVLDSLLFFAYLSKVWK
jgi:Ran GTPase-activating protein (RanGAP) involved in mRNA processing and transport